MGLVFGSCFKGVQFDGSGPFGIPRAQFITDLLVGSRTNLSFTQGSHKSPSFAKFPSAFHAGHTGSPKQTPCATSRTNSKFDFGLLLGVSGGTSEMCYHMPQMSQASGSLDTSIPLGAKKRNKNFCFVCLQHS